MTLVLGLLTMAFFGTEHFADEVRTRESTALATEMAEKAGKFLDALEPAKKSKALMAFDNPARLDWHWIPKPERKGAKLGDMPETQKQAAEDLIKTGLSEVGYQKSLVIRKLESALKILEKDTRGIRDPVKYYITIFGTPGPTGEWGWSCEGHHLSVNYVIRNGAIASSEPTFMGANPRLMTETLDVGPKPGTRTLDSEEQLAFQLARSLTEEQRTVAVNDTLPNKTLQSGPPAKLYAGEPQGLSASKMTAQQKAMLTAAVNCYLDNVPAAAREQRQAAIAKAGMENVHFYWMGAVDLDKSHYFRIHGPTFIIELDNVQADPQGRIANHIHSVWRTPSKKE